MNGKPRTFTFPFFLLFYYLNLIFFFLFLRFIFVWLFFVRRVVRCIYVCDWVVVAPSYRRGKNIFCYGVLIVVKGMGRLIFFTYKKICYLTLSLHLTLEA